MKAMQTIFAMALVIGANASAADLQTIVDYDANKINATLTIEDYNDDILFYLADAEMDINSITNTNIASSVFDVRDVSGTAGKYSVSLPFPNERGKKYKLVYANYNAIEDVGGSDISQRQKIVYIASAAEINTLLSAFNSATATSVLDEINTYKDILDLSIEEGHTLVSTDKKDADLGTLFAANRPSSGYLSIKDICEDYKKARAASEILNASSDEMENALEIYGDVLGIEIDEDYYEHKEKANSELIKAYSELPRDNKSYQMQKQIYRENIAVIVINSSTRDTISSVLEKYNDVFGLTLSGKYASLSVNDKTEFNKALERKNFSSPSDVNKAFNSRLSTFNNSPGGGGGGGTSGNGNRSWTYYTAQGDGTQESEAEAPNDGKDTDTKAEIFNDLGGVPWAKNAIYGLAEMGIVSGYGDGTFRPNDHITRNEFIKMLITAFNIYSEDAKYNFTDGDKNAWYAQYIASAEAAGVLLGYSDGRFGDGENITREDMSVFIYRISKLRKSKDVQYFADDGLISDYAKEAVYSLQEKGIVNGMDDNVFAPKEFATRAQAASVLYRVLRGESQ